MRWRERHGGALSGLLVKVAKAAGQGDLQAGIAVMQQEAPGLLAFYQRQSGLPVL